MYICRKQLNLNGKIYNPGDKIQEENVLPSRRRLLESAGYIVKALDDIVMGECAAELIETGGATGKVVVPIFLDSSDETAEVIAVPLSEAEIQEVFSVMQMTVTGAKAHIENITEKNVLTVLSACETRSGVKKAVKECLDKVSIT